MILPFEERWAAASCSISIVLAVVASLGFGERKKAGDLPCAFNRRLYCPAFVFATLAMDVFRKVISTAVR